MGKTKSFKKQLVTDSARHLGLAGHVALAYPSGGILLTSAGHWVELQRVKTDEKSFFKAMASEYGTNSKRSKQMFDAYSRLETPMEQERWLLENSALHVQSRHCGAYSKKKS